MKGLIKRKFAQAITYPARSLYRFLEADEFMFMALDHVVKLRPDVVHCHDLATLTAGLKISDACSSKLVYDSHELEMHRNTKYTVATKLRRRKQEQRGIKRADAVITVSESIADHLMDDYKIRRPYVVLNAPDFSEHEKSSRMLRQDLCLSNDIPLAVYVGNVTVNRGLEFVVRALVHYPDLHLATVGPRRSATTEELRDLAIELHVEDRLHFVDAVPPEAVVGYISTADCSVLPIQNVCLSYYYCMPNKLLESVFSGIPVAVANLLEMRRFVETFRCGVVMDEKSPVSIAEAIKIVIKGRENYTVTQNVIQKLHETYSWTAQVEKLRSIYKNL